MNNIYQIKKGIELTGTNPLFPSGAVSETRDYIDSTLEDNTRKREGYISPESSNTMWLIGGIGIALFAFLVIKK